MPVSTLYWRDDGLVLLNQTLLPTEVVYLTCKDVETIARAIEELKVRGAPAIGIAAAYGVVVGARQAVDAPPEEFQHQIQQTIERLASTRPTAVNLFWALEQMRQTADRMQSDGNREICTQLLATANRIFEEDRSICRRIGHHGATLLQDDYQIITHCNAGGLGTADYGTALGLVYAAAEEGKKISVFADETRPLLQGSRLTAWELMQNGIDVTLICDNMAASVMHQKRIDCVVVGADRIAANGDVANKIGTYGLAVLAKEHGVPFYVAAPASTLDQLLPSGDEIPIEERCSEEITCGMGRRTAPEGVRVYNPAFDVTPHSLVAAIISEKGIARPPFAPMLRQWLDSTDV